VEYGGYTALETTTSYYNTIASESNLKKIYSIFCKQQDSIFLVVNFFILLKYHVFYLSFTVDLLGS